MTKERKQLIKNFKEVIADLLDNYELYTEAEKKQIKEVFQKVADLNKVLDKYDVERKSNWFEYLDVYNRYFEQKDY